MIHPFNSRRLALFRSAPRIAALLLTLVAALLFLPAIALAQAPAGVGTVAVTRADGALTASWNAPGNAVAYHITYSTDSGVSWSLGAMDHTGTTWTLGSADNAKTYIIGVRARNSANEWGGWTNSASAGPYTPPNNPSTPGSVGAITVTRADGAITASWNAVSNATKYHITYTTDGGASWHAPVDDNANYPTNSVAFAGDNAKTYIIGARAGNGAGWSGWTNSAPAGPFTPEPTPTPTPGIIVQDSNGNAITTLSVPEGGEASYQVKLASPIEKDAKVCIGLSVLDNNDPDITFKGEASGVMAINLTFTPENWDTAQTVTLIAAEDDDDVNGVRDVDHDSRDWYFSGKVDLAVTEVDND